MYEPSKSQCIDLHGRFKATFQRNSEFNIFLSKDNNLGELVCIVPSIQA